MKILWYILAVLVPFITVFIRTRNPAKALITFVLTLLFWVPGVIYALYQVHKTFQDGVAGGSEELEAV